MLSADRLRQYRPPSYKPSQGKWQANFEQRLVPRGTWQNNGHLDIVDPWMEATIRYLHSPDVDMETFIPDDPTDIGILIQIIAGPVDGPGEESFDVMVCTPRWLERSVRPESPLIGRHYLIVHRYDPTQIRQYLTSAVESEEAPTWRELAERIGRLGKGEFEDYRPFESGQDD
jgi:hypothetical protein